MNSPLRSHKRNGLSVLQNPDLLRQEVQYLCHTIFDTQPSDATISRYAQFHEVYQTSLLSQQQVNVNLLVVDALDADAIEFFLRTLQRENTLTSKIWVCAYLLELQQAEEGGAAPRLEKQRTDSPFAILPMLGWLGVRSAFKWVKGAIYVYRADLI